MHSSHQSYADSPQDLPDSLNPPLTDSQDGQLLNVQDLFDGLLNYVSSTTEEIIETANKLQENCSEAKLVLEKLKTNGVLNRDLDNNKPRNSNISQSLLGKRSNPFIEIDKEAVLQPDLEVEEMISPQIIMEEEESSQSIESESNGESAVTEDYEADLSTNSSVPLPKTFADKATQTSPIIPVNFIPNELNFNFLAPNFTFAMNNDVQNGSQEPEQNFNESEELQIQKLPEPIQPENVSLGSGQVILIQPVYLIQPIQIINYLPQPLQETSLPAPSNEVNDEIQEL